MRRRVEDNLMVNARGFERVMPRVGGNRQLNRRDPLVDEAESRTAAAIRATSGNVDTDDVVRVMKYFLNELGVVNYFLVHHEIGGASCNAWVPKFLERWDLERVRVNPKYRSRRNGVTLVDQVLEGWRDYYSLQERVHLAMGGAAMVEWTLFTMDETSIRRTVPKTTIMGAEQKRSVVGRDGSVAVEYTTLDCSIGAVLCSNGRVTTPDPFLVVPQLALAEQEALFWIDGS